ncbi:MAG: hypothetical protein JSS77_16110 [Acidobacteria bacterium]|nr:hypothetical protein [Acidobacteriota bacterium]
MSGEAKFQSKMLTALKGQGCIVQKFTDRFTKGICDTLACLPTQDMAVLTKYPPGMWMEIKSTLDVPALSATSWDKAMIPDVDQRRWMKDFGKSVFPAMVVMSTPWGWTAYPEWAIDEVFDTPHAMIHLVNHRNAITYAAIYQEYARWIR